MYWFVFGILLINASICFVIKKELKALYYFSLIMLTFFLCLRYGQGLDYGAYRWLYLQTPETFTFQHVFYTEGVHGELGWKLLSHIFSLFGFSYISFVSFVGLLNMLFLHLFICKMCPARSLALLLVFPTLYLTYFFSAMRQGLAMSLFLGVVLKYLFRKRYVLYLLGVAVCMSFHFTSVIYLIPLLFVFLNIKPKTMAFFFYLCVPIGIVIALPITQSVIRRLPLPGNMLLYITTGSILWPAIFERIITMGFVVIVYLLNDKKNKDAVASWAMSVYIFSISVYMTLFWASSMGRLIYPLKLFEIILLCKLLPKLPRWRKAAYLFIVVVSIIMFVKNLNSNITLGGMENTSVFNYPYYTIFDQRES